jgi:hypothetical protein
VLWVSAQGERTACRTSPGAVVVFTSREINDGLTGDCWEAVAGPLDVRGPPNDVRAAPWLGP